MSIVKPDPAGSICPFVSCQDVTPGFHDMAGRRAILWPALPQFSIWNPRAINRLVNSLQDTLALVVRSSSFLRNFSNSVMNKIDY